MMMSEENTKKVYEKPLLRVIELTADEVLAVGCKSPGLNYAVGGNPSCGVGAGCVSLGS